MGLLAQNSDDPQFAANMALAAGLLQGNMGGGLLGFSNALAQGKQQGMQNQLLQAQLRNYDSEIEARKLKTIQDQRQQAMIASLFGGAPGSTAPAGPGLPGLEQYEAKPQSAPYGGMGPSMPSAPQSTGTAPQGGLLALSKQLGIPPEVIQSDIVFNGGKKISEYLNTRSAPKWENINGNLVNTNAPGFQGGLQAGVSAGNGGQVTMWQPDGNGGLVVGAPRGALDTFRAYQQTGEGVKADNELVTVTPQGQPPQQTTRGNLLRTPGVGSVIPPGVQASRDAERKTILQSELTKAQQNYQSAIARNDQSGASRAQSDIAAISRELGGSAPAIGMPLQSPEEALRASQGATEDSKRNVALAGEVSKSRDMQGQIARARELLQRGPTASGIGSLVDKGAAVFGASTTGAELAAGLDTISGNLTSNVPRMEGPQSNFDVENYKIMAGRVGDRSLPVAQRMASLDEVERLQKKYAAYNGGTAPEAGQNLIQSLPKTAPKGQRVRDTASGKILKFNGLSWVEEK